MATWNVSLPDTKAVGDATHVEDHNVLVQAISEARAALDAKADSADLASKADSADLAAKADSADLAAKADASALSALEARVAALETPAG